MSTTLIMKHGIDISTFNDKIEGYSRPFPIIIITRFSQYK